MTVANIIHHVRWCIDEETGAESYIDTYADRLIMSRIQYALRWACLYSDPSLLMSGAASGEASSSGAVVTSIKASDGVITLPQNFLKVLRVRSSDWKKGVSVPVTEDSDEYLMQSDETAKAGVNCPVVAYIASTPQRLELYPKPGTGASAEATIVISPDYVTETSNMNETTDVSIPSGVRTSFIYYLAYLVMCAYNDSRAGSMYEIAKQNLGLAQEGR